eukprot:s180_g26.t1
MKLGTVPCECHESDGSSQLHCKQRFPKFVGSRSSNLVPAQNAERMPKQMVEVGRPSTVARHLRVFLKLPPAPAWVRFEKVEMDGEDVQWQLVWSNCGSETQMGCGKSKVAKPTCGLQPLQLQQGNTSTDARELFPEAEQAEIELSQPLVCGDLESAPYGNPKPGGIRRIRSQIVRGDDDKDDGLLLKLAIHSGRVEEVEEVESSQELALADMESLDPSSKENVVERTIWLQQDEEVLAFFAQEVQDESGSAVYFHPHAIIRNPSGVWMEPLSRHFVWPPPHHKGACTLLPDIKSIKKKLNNRSHIFNSIDLTETDQKHIAPMEGLRTLVGEKREHIIGVTWPKPRDTSEWSVKAVTGQPAMFWFELICLDCVAWYTDFLLDVKQLFLFSSTNMMDYFYFNAAGMLFPIMLNARDVVQFLQGKSPEKDSLAHTTALSPLYLMSLGVGAVVLQLHIFGLTVWSAAHRHRHPLLASSKNAEVAESATSALVQSNYLVCAMCGVEAFEQLELTNLDMGFLAASVVFSCGMLGLGFASRDKQTSRVLHLPGKLDWSLSFVMLIFIRSIEVVTRVFGINLIHISTRLPHFKAGGPAMLVVLALLSKIPFEEATPADVLAAVVGHPGQLLEPNTLLPLRVSLLLDAVLVVTLLVAQTLVHVDLVSEHSKVLPTEILASWLALTAVSCIGRSIFQYGIKVTCPIWDGLASESGDGERNLAEVQYSALPAAFRCSREVPRCAK